MNKLKSSEMQNKHRYVASLDAHKRTYFMKLIDVLTNKVIFNSGIIGSIVEVISLLDSFKLAKKDVVVLYEAGCVGFDPYFRLTKAGYTCLIIAPSSIPYNNRLHKTDKQDCGNNLGYYLSGILRFVTVPDQETLQIRELNRYRETLVNEIRRKQQQINAFTLRNGYIFTETKSEWTMKHRKWLKSLNLSPILQGALSLMLSDLEHEELNLEKVDKELELHVKQNTSLNVTTKALQLFPGIGKVVANGLALEGGNFGRFSKASQVPQFVGLVPAKQQTGNSDPALSITKEGNGLIRRMLVSASKYYGNHRYLYSEKELAKLPPGISPFVKKMQDRLYSRYRYLKNRGKHTNKVRCAIARELSIFIWDYLLNIVPKHHDLFTTNDKLAITKKAA